MYYVYHFTLHTNASFPFFAFFLAMAQRVAVSDAAGGSKRPSRVRVAVRLRPYMEKQGEKAEAPCVRGLGPQTLEIINWRNSTETLQYQ